jgi:hypothetical protein
VIEAADKNSRDNMITLFLLAMGTLIVSHITISETLYYAYGHELNEPIVFFLLPQDNWFVLVVEALYMFVILFSFPYDIWVTNYVTEYLLFSSMRYSETRKWLKNLSRALIIAASLTVSTLFYDYIPHITGLAGILIGVPVVMITPALLNNDLYAKENTC